MSDELKVIENALVDAQLDIMPPQDEAEKTLFERLVNVSFDLGQECLHIGDAVIRLSADVDANEVYGAPMAPPEVDAKGMAEAITAADIMGQVKAAHHLLSQATQRLGESRLGQLHPTKSTIKE